MNIILLFSKVFLWQIGADTKKDTTIVMATQKACAIMQSCYKLCKDYYGICQKRQDQTVTSIRGYKN